jgi:hypothetical protein
MSDERYGRPRKFCSEKGTLSYVGESEQVVAENNSGCQGSSCAARYAVVRLSGTPEKYISSTL